MNVIFAIATGVMFGLYPSRPESGVLSVIAERLGRPDHPAIMGDIVRPRDSEDATRISEKLMRERAIQKLIPMSHQIRGASVHGVVLVDIVVSELGFVDDATFASGPEEVAELCEEAALGWKFRPWMKAGEAVRVRTKLTFNFK